jgi:putative DNA primase/helicase
MTAEELLCALQETKDEILRHNPDLEKHEKARRKNKRILCGRKMSQIQCKPVQWLMPNIIPMGALTVLCGDAGLGKSTLSLEIAARVSRSGSQWPFDLGLVPHGRVLLMSEEDSLETTVRPRLDKHDADCENIEHLHIQLNESEMPVDFSKDINLLDERLTIMADVRLVVVDPLPLFLGNIDTHNNAEVRRILSPLKRIAERHNVAILGIMHPNKDKASSTALNRISGSNAFTQQARAVLYLALKENRRLLFTIKENLAEYNKTISMPFTFNNLGRIEWASEMDTTIDADWLIIGDRKTAEAMSEAIDDIDRSPAERFLIEILKNGPYLVKQIYRKGREEHGLSVQKLDRAKKKLGVLSFKSRKFVGEYSWCFPIHFPKTGDDFDDIVAYIDSKDVSDGSLSDDLANQDNSLNQSESTDTSSSSKSSLKIWSEAEKNDLSNKFIKKLLRENGSDIADSEDEDNDDQPA